MSTPSFQVLPEPLPNSGILYVNHQAVGRSGHGGSCLTECANGDILAFYSNVDGKKADGHGVDGWTEYRRSSDGGETWSEPCVLEYSKKIWETKEAYSALAFAATTAPDGTVLVFVFTFERDLWVKKADPLVLRSRDHGKSWEAPTPLDPAATVEDASLTFDAVCVRDEQVFLVTMGGSANYCPGPHRLYASSDNGESFEMRSELPFHPENYYVTMGVLPDGDLIVYSYPYRRNESSLEEHNMDYVTSNDADRTWTDVKTSHFAKAIRNPQMSSLINGIYFLHGRSGSKSENPGNFVLYSSRNGIEWDEGLFLHLRSALSDCYSANAVVGKYRPEQPLRLLIQSSISYEGNRVNLRHWWVENVKA